MPYVAVTVEHDLNSRAVMDALTDDGLVLLAGPEARLAEDPWRPLGLLRTADIEPWEVLLDGRH